MNAELTPPAEEPLKTDLVSHEALNARLELFERGFTSRLEPTIKEAAQKIADSAIWEFKRELESTRRDQELAKSSKRLDCSIEWSARLIAVAVGFILCLIFVTGLSQCTDLHQRISTLESKQK
jgi:hypothetical protein